MMKEVYIVKEYPENGTAEICLVEESTENETIESCLVEENTEGMLHPLLIGVPVVPKTVKDQYVLTNYFTVDAIHDYIMHRLEACSEYEISEYSNIEHTVRYKNTEYVKVPGEVNNSSVVFDFDLIDNSTGEVHELYVELAITDLTQASLYYRESCDADAICIECIPAGDFLYWPAASKYVLLSYCSYLEFMEPEQDVEYPF